jgi:hypothetical protein
MSAYIYVGGGLDPHLLSVTSMEAAACGTRSIFHPWMTRDWVVKHASIESQSDKLF